MDIEKWYSRYLDYRSGMKQAQREIAHLVSELRQPAAYIGYDLPLPQTALSRHNISDLYVRIDSAFNLGMQACIQQEGHALDQHIAFVRERQKGWQNFVVQYAARYQYITKKEKVIDRGRRDFSYKLMDGFFELRDELLETGQFDDAEPDPQWKEDKLFQICPRELPEAHKTLRANVFVSVVLSMQASCETAVEVTRAYSRCGSITQVTEEFGRWRSLITNGQHDRLFTGRRAGTYAQMKPSYPKHKK